MKKTKFDSIPLFDLREYFTQKDNFIIRLRQVCHEVGFFYIIEHGIPLALRKKMFFLAKTFFDLPQEEKDRMGIHLSPHYRGYGKLNAELTQGKPDFKETLDFGLEQSPKEAAPEHPYHILKGPNLWPTSTLLRELQFKETVLQYITSMQKLGNTLMNAMALTLGLREDYFAEYFTPNVEDDYAILRLLRYPPGRTNNLEQPEIGVGTHTDFGCLAFLLQDDVGGLQVQNCAGEWIDAPPIEDSFIVNIGEMLQVWSNHFFLATPHRVINFSSAVRYSIPFFFEPHLSTVVTPIQLSREITNNMQRNKANPDIRLVYGNEILKVYKRSFSKE